MTSEETNQPKEGTASDDPSAEGTTAEGAAAFADEAFAGDLDSVLSAEEQALMTLRAERDDFLDSLQRLKADFDNYRKRSLRDQEAAAERAGEKLITKLLPVLDTFELAMSHADDVDASPMAKLHDALLSALESEGLERLAPQGEAFDPSVADAVVHEDADVDAPGPVVSEVLRAGYRWKSKVVRAAMVKVKG